MIKKRIVSFGLCIIVAVAGIFLSTSIASTTVVAESYSFDSAIKKIEEVDGFKKGNLNPENTVVKVIKYLMYAVGVVSVVMIIIGGIRYATSGGNAEKVKTAKNTILYACVGLAVALLALAIVSYVDKLVDGAKTSSGPTQNPNNHNMWTY